MVCLLGEVNGKMHVPSKSLVKFLEVMRHFAKSGTKGNVSSRIEIMYFQGGLINHKGIYMGTKYDTSL
jgi:hypothetical protein